MQHHHYLLLHSKYFAQIATQNRYQNKVAAIKHSNLFYQDYLLSAYLHICIFTHYQTIIFSIGITNIPSAPAALNCLIFSQNSSSFNTLCTELQPDSASGKTVGLRIPGNNFVILSSESLGAFSSTYLFLLALR